MDIQALYAMVKISDAQMASIPKEDLKRMLLDNIARGMAEELIKNGLIQLEEIRDHNDWSTEFRGKLFVARNAQTAKANTFATAPPPNKEWKFIGYDEGSAMDAAAYAMFNKKPETGNTEEPPNVTETFTITVEL